MNVIAILAVAVGVWNAEWPVLELRALSSQVSLPAGAAEQWDAIGTFKIRDGNATTTVKLYYADSDSIAEKAGDGGMYPNSFVVHALYRQENGGWKYKALLHGRRCGFWKVAEVAPKGLTIEIRSKYIIFSNNTVPLTAELLERISKPTPFRLTVKAGEPVLD